MRKVFALILIVIVGMFLFTACEDDSSEQGKTAKTVEKVKKQARKSNEVKISFTEDEKQYLSGVARKALEHWVKNEERYRPDDVPASLKGRKVNRVFATIYKKGDWRGCVSAKGRDAVDATVKSVINTCKDKRFENPAVSELNDIRVEVSFLQPFELISTKDPEQIKKELEPGVHGISVKHSSGKRAFFLPYVFVKKQRTTITWLERICKKAGLKKDDWKSPETSIYRYGTINFIEETPNGRAVDLYRYKVELDSLKKTAVTDAIDLSVKWFAKSRNDQSNEYLTGYNMKHKAIRKNDVTLQMFANAAIAKANTLGVKGADIASVEQAVSKGMSDLMIEIPTKDQLESLLVLAEAVVNGEKIKNRKKLASQLLDYFKDHSADIVKNGKRIKDLSNYAVFVISGLAETSKSKQHIKFASEFYGDNWMPGAGYSLLALLAFNKVAKTDGMNEKIIKETKLIISKQYTSKMAPYRDFIGSFKNGKTPSTFGVSVYLRSLASIYKYWTVTESFPHENGELRQSILDASMFATRWILEQQFTEESAFYFKSYKDALGAFKQDILLNTTMLDDTANALLALLSTNQYLGKEISEAFENSADVLVK